MTFCAKSLFSSLIAFLIVFVQVPVAKSALIVGYSGAQTPVVSTDPGATNAGITRGPGVSQGGSGVYETKDWTTGGSVDLNDYIQWGWTASTGYGYDLDDLQIQYRRTGSGPTNLDIRLSVNGGSFTSIFTDASITTGGTGEFHNINLTAYNGVTSAIFRLYGFSANNPAGQIDLVNYTAGPPAFAVTVNGVVATPEPSSLAVFTVGGVLAGWFGWRRRKATSAHNA